MPDFRVFFNLRSVEVRKSTYGAVHHYIIKMLLIYLKSSGLFLPGLKRRTSRMLSERDNPYTTGTGCWPSVGLTSTEKQQRTDRSALFMPGGPLWYNVPVEKAGRRAILTEDRSTRTKTHLYRVIFCVKILHLECLISVICSLGGN